MHVDAGHQIQRGGWDFGGVEALLASTLSSSLASGEPLHA